MNTSENHELENTYTTQSDIYLRMISSTTQSDIALSIWEIFQKEENKDKPQKS